jgi:hypothetical protein
MVCPYLEDLWELYLLGVLSAEDAHTVSNHLATGCARCCEQMREAALTVTFLTQTGHTVRPDPKSKASLLRRLQKR